MAEKWLTPEEVKEPGFYLFGRADDDELNSEMIELILNDDDGCLYSLEYVAQSGTKIQCETPVYKWDDECRFLPIPKLA